MNKFPGFGRLLNVLQRIQKNEAVSFKSNIRSNLSYCPIIWHFCSKVDTEKLERLQYRGLKIVFKCYESFYEEFLTKER